jgi:hypothetical protein
MEALGEAARSGRSTWLNLVGDVLIQTLNRSADDRARVSQNEGLCDTPAMVGRRYYRDGS